MPTLTNQNPVAASKPANTSPFTQAATSMFSPPAQQQNVVRKSLEKESIISDKIVDDYEDDFEGIEESSRLKAAEKNKKVLSGEEESSGGFNEKYDEDFF